MQTIRYYFLHGYGWAILFFYLVTAPVYSQPIPMLYQTNCAVPSTDRENQLIEHVISSIQKANQLQSKLTGVQFVEVDASKQWRENSIPNYHGLSDISKIPAYHLLNNLCNLQGASHLHVGLLFGDSYIAALYGNQSKLEQQIGIDWFKECTENIFHENCNLYLDTDKYQILNQNCFAIDKAIFKAPIDIYFYDADHSLLGHERALTYYNDIFADIFIVIIDDWNCPWIRLATFKAFTKLNYHILYETILEQKINKNIDYIAIIRKYR